MEKGINAWSKRNRLMNIKRRYIKREREIRREQEKDE
jgi:hypothetical protein